MRLVTPAFTRVLSIGCTCLSLAACRSAPPVVRPGVPTVEATPGWCLNGPQKADTTSYFFGCGSGESRMDDQAIVQAYNAAVVEIARRMNSATNVTLVDLRRTLGVDVAEETQRRLEVSANGFETARDSTKLVAVEGQGTYKAWVLARTSRREWALRQMRTLGDIPGFDKLADSTRARLTRPITGKAP